MKRHFFFLISSIILLSDQIIKYYIRILKPDYGIIHYTTNTGAAFGIFSGNNIFFASSTLIVSLLIIYFYIFKPIYFRQTYVKISAALILGGALGNLTDRLIQGHVIDYIDTGFWPVFNLADISLCIGVIILLFNWYLEDKKRIRK
ncbi:MAG: signal peptidase II [Candidatus Woesearchaeota archaeon]|jgi:signal peptidase II